MANDRRRDLRGRRVDDPLGIRAALGTKPVESRRSTSGKQLNKVYDSKRWGRG